MCLIPPVSQTPPIVSDFFVPLFAAFIGGLFVLLGTFIQSRITEKHTEQTRRRNLSIESVRQIDILLFKLRNVHFSFGERFAQDGDLDEDEDEIIISICTEMQLHAAYIDNDRVRQAVQEAALFLWPRLISISPDESQGAIATKVSNWLRPMLVAHTHDTELPPEPDYVETYRRGHEESEQRLDEILAQGKQNQPRHDH